MDDISDGAYELNVGSSEYEEDDVLIGSNSWWDCDNAVVSDELFPPPTSASIASSGCDLDRECDRICGLSRRSSSSCGRGSSREYPPAGDAAYSAVSELRASSLSYLTLFERQPVSVPSFPLVGVVAFGRPGGRRRALHQHPAAGERR
eukprot:CAMPEP_0181133884 /NCGR_PEP_ID=MMETSP1071-20121207/31761_1 /TAXON_ID=35127 /ORGANISM="Thalassiosira sp., Strain NH16" /LENGTH=147 /DNA_ID=CAMNT_0023220303 /DNA_START=79 /DNA_END=522 /DNA_ORIENTATION=+